MLGKTVVEVAVEQRGRGFGRCRMQVIADASAATLRALLLVHVEPGSVVLTGGFPSYPSACGKDYVHRRTSISGSGHQAHEPLPGVHRVASHAKRWLEATHQGAAKPALVPSHLDEFCFRFNRRHSRARGMLFYRLLEQPVQSAPRTYRCLVAEPGSARPTMPVPPLDERVHCESIARAASIAPGGQPLGRGEPRATALRWRGLWYKTPRRVGSTDLWAAPTCGCQQPEQASCRSGAIALSSPAGTSRSFEAPTPGEA